MILVDTSVWIDHLRSRDQHLVTLLEDQAVLIHPFVRGELACGNLKNRKTVLAYLAQLPQASMATHEEVLHFIDARGLHGLGIGYIDCHLLAACLLSRSTRLWSHDTRLKASAKELRLSYDGPYADDDPPWQLSEAPQSAGHTV